MIASIILSITYGLIVGVSPCHMPLYPVLLNILAKHRNNAKASVVAFTLGIALMYATIYLLLALALRLIETVVVENFMASFYKLMYLFAAVICLLFSLQSLGKITFYSRILSLKFKPKPSVFGAFITGVFFATVVSPCNLPYLVAMFLPLLSGVETTTAGLLSVLAFSFSISIPLLVAGLFSDYVFRLWVKKHMSKIETASGIMLLLLAAYFLYLAITS